MALASKAGQLQASAMAGLPIRWTGVLGEREPAVAGWGEGDLDSAAVLESQCEDGIRVAQEREHLAFVVAGQQLSACVPPRFSRRDYDGDLEAAENGGGVGLP